MPMPSNKSGNVGIIDYSGRLLTNDNVRYELATGNGFRWGYRTTLAAGARIWFLFDPSLNETVTETMYKFRAALTTTGSPVNMESWEGATVSAPGTEIIVYNFNRCSDCDASLNPYAKMYHTPTIDSSGNKYAPDTYVYADTSTPGLALTSQGQAEDEYSAWLNPLYKYLWKITNIGSESTTLSVGCRIIREYNYNVGGR